jgi:DNA polymerase I
MSKLFLLDGMALAYRGHFALIRNPRMTSSGMNTSMAFVFANTLLDILNNQQPTHMAVAFDTPEPTHRHKMYEEYKATREAIPEDIAVGLPYIFKLCEGFRLPVLRMPGWEADDVIGTLAKKAEAEGVETYMVTPDKDYAQLVSETTSILKPGRTGSGAEVLGVKEILAEWEIERVEQVIDVLGLMGDSSDNVPGVPGIGPKTAKKLIAEYGSVENLLDHLDERKGKQKENLENNREQALLSKKLVTIELDVPVEVGLPDLVVKDRDVESLKALFVELEFNVLGQRLFGEDFQAGPQRSLGFGEAVSADGDEAGEAEQDVPKTLADVKHDYQVADTPEAMGTLVGALAEQEAFCFDLETSRLDSKRCSIVGLAFSIEPHAGWYVPCPEDREEALKILETFRGVLENPEIAKIGHNLKFDLSVLKWHGLEVAGPIRDTMLAAHVVMPDLRRSMDYLAQALLGYKPKSITELIGEKGEDQKSMRDVPVAEVAEYAAEDADITLQLWQLLEPKVKEEKQERVFDEVECPLVPVLVDMEFNGIRLDPTVLEDLSAQLEMEIARSRDRIFELADEEFNLNSPKQLGEILFEKLSLDPNAKRTQKSKQYRTNEQVLTRLAFQHEIAERVLFYRECTKLKSTYVDMLPGAVFKETGRIHTNYEQAVTATGRMQSSNPNMQNIPIRTEQGREIRKAFVPRDDDHTLLAADYSQIELRIMAELSGDEGMLTAFENGEDIHAATSVKVYGVDLDYVTDEMRRQAKTVNFGIIYGISPFGLAERLGISRYQAADLIDQYFATYPGVKDYMDKTIAFAGENGYVETITGRRRFLRDITSKNATTRKAAERNAINSPIQGSAADMIKIAMTTIYREMRAQGLKSKMLLQVHDELVFDMHRSETEVLPAIVEDGMKHAIEMKVPIVVEMGTGENWLDAH